ncbi:four-carbon acid sugar kinase family protein [Mycetocola zhujimingii]|uniref:four-carbon acid sugar kinase family protein n=1 Tax=Mycetocola zhujimingii TaxID=2079792 RepID=UPI000D38F4EB|nr:four-carbon acid sugar kinase family protein [Mycetocola zhujimingii]AWB87588.1 serine kinase [Mycetocola zhujimingii]
MTVTDSPLLIQRTTLAAPAGIVADDLTGATDSAVQFARVGWTARLALTSPAAGTADTLAGSVTAVITDARAQDSETANEGTALAVTGLMASGIERLFVKVDSTLRGSVIDQVTGALSSWSVRHPDALAVVCSAYPAMGRTIESGQLLVHGAGVHTTAIGRDPVTPVTTSAVAELLPGSVALRLTSASAAENAAQLQAAAVSSRIVAVDAVTDADLSTLAEAIALLGPRAIPTGAAGLAIAMSHVWASEDAATVDPDGHAESAETAAIQRVVVVVSSLHDVSRAQVDELMAQLPRDAVRTLTPTLEQALTPASTAAWAERELAGSPELPAVVVIASPSERPARDVGQSKAPASDLIAQSLAIISDAVISESPVGAIVLLGGEGARAVLATLGAESLVVRDTVREGIPIGVLEGGKADGITIVTKAGGFGTPTSVAEIVQELFTTADAHDLFSGANTEGTLS